MLDGFPRTLKQVEKLSEYDIDIDHVLEIRVSDEEIIRRISGRRVHLASGRVYHVANNPPQQEGLDDETSEPLIQRTDDQEDIVRQRLETYHDQTEPLIEYYSRLAESGVEGAPRYHMIEGIGTIEEIRDQAFAALDQG